MLTIGQQKLDPLLLTVVAVFGALAAALAIGAPGVTVWAVVGLAGLAGMVYWAIRWEITLWAWIWVLSFGIVGRGFWKLEIPGFFNMTIPRFIFMGAVMAFVLHFLLRRRRIRYNEPAVWAMLLLSLYCAASATLAGWVIPAGEIVIMPPYFRFLGGLLFPFIMFFLVYNSTRSENQIRLVGLLFTGYGWYALYLAYMQYAANMGLAGARAFIWPGYINDPEFGIHFARSRGAFISASPQAVLLVMLFYVDLFLILKTRGLYRAALVVQAILTVPGIFFTGIRAGYLGLLLCGGVWCLWGGTRRFGRLKLTAALMALLLLVVVFWGNLAQTERRTGGVAQASPIWDRLSLMRVMWQMAREHPVTGVGFGHFVAARQQLGRDPATRELWAPLMQHNLFFGMLAETGVIGLAGMVAVFALTFKRSIRLYRKLPPTAVGLLSRPFVVLFWIVMLNYVTASMFFDTMTDVFSTSAMWSIAGLVVGYDHLLEPHLIELPAAGAVAWETKVVPTRPPA